jgi:hypothetical protein
MDMVLAKSDMSIASRYAELVADAALREKIYSRLRSEWDATVRTLLAITEQQTLLQGNPLLARSIRNRFPYIDALHHIQVELIKRLTAMSARNTTAKQAGCCPQHPALKSLHSLSPPMRDRVGTSNAIAHVYCSSASCDQNLISVLFHRGTPHGAPMLAH